MTCSSSICANLEKRECYDGVCVHGSCRSIRRKWCEIGPAVAAGGGTAAAVGGTAVYNRARYGEGNLFLQGRARFLFFKTFPHLYFFQYSM